MMESELKTGIKKLIDLEKDENLLRAIKALLSTSNKEDILRIKLTARALQSEADILANNVLNEEEALYRTNQHLHE